MNPSAPLPSYTHFKTAYHQLTPSLQNCWGSFSLFFSHRVILDRSLQISSASLRSMTRRTALSSILRVDTGTSFPSHTSADTGVLLVSKTRGYGPRSLSTIPPHWRST